MGGQEWGLGAWVPGFSGKGKQSQGTPSPSPNTSLKPCSLCVKGQNLTHHFQEEVHVRPLVHEEPDRVFIYDNLGGGGQGPSGAGGASQPPQPHPLTPAASSSPFYSSLQPLGRWAEMGAGHLGSLQPPLPSRSW